MNVGAPEVAGEFRLSASFLAPTKAGEKIFLVLVINASPLNAGAEIWWVISEVMQVPPWFLGKLQLQPSGVNFSQFVLR